MRFSALSTTLALAAVTACLPALAQSADQARTAHHDTEFLKDANQGSRDEIDLAQLALKKSNDQDVKDFAQKMIDDHTKLLDDMKPFDMQAGLSIPDHDDAATDAQKAKLELLSGTTFDKAYIKDMVEDHHKDLEQFMAQEKSTGYPDFKAAVAKGEAVVKQHLELADSIAKKLGVATAPVPSGD
jgi:putative membrane protein